MFRRKPSAQAERAAAAIVALRMELLDAATAYNVMSVSDGGDLDAAWEPLERLAARARDAEELGADELGDDFLSREGRALLAAVEDSLVLALSDDEDRRALRLAAHEVTERLEAVRQEGTWDG